MAKVSRHTLNHILAQNLRMIYNLRRGSLEEFSDELGVGHTTIQNILREKGNPTLDTLELMASRLGVSPLQLISFQYPEPNVVHASLLLETVELFQTAPPERRREAVALFCRLLELLTQEP